MAEKAKTKIKTDPGTPAASVTTPMELIASALRRVWLNGAIPECVLQYNKGVVRVEAIDWPNSITVFVHRNVGALSLPSLAGIHELRLFVAMLDEAIRQDKHSTIEHKSAERLELHCKATGSRISYLMANTDTITADCRGENALEKMTAELTHTFQVTPEQWATLNTYVNMFEFDNVGVEVRPDRGVAIVKGGNDMTHQFTARLGGVKPLNKKAANDPFEVLIVRKLLGAMLGCLTTDETLTVEVGAGNPVKFSTGNDTWCFVPQKEDA